MRAESDGRSMCARESRFRFRRFGGWEDYRVGAATYILMSLATESPSAWLDLAGTPEPTSGAHVAHFEWTSDLETGHDDIDSQHRSLFGLSNALQDAIADESADDETVADCVWQLTDYVVQHFADEEEIMASSGYPALGAHRSLHEHLTAETMRLTARYMNGEDVAPATLAPFLTRWLTEHIHAEDARVAAHIRKREDVG